jgi:hypothetical protein
VALATIFGRLMASIGPRRRGDGGAGNEDPDEYEV